ncbi:MAG: PEGA domain-containing protein [Deltaproteobacteria bacterium]|nr:MAG: PEGA domain-containing protein [Deltaproteobacteria bacterium]
MFSSTRFHRVAAVFAVGVLAGVAVEAHAQTEPRPERRGRKYRVRIDSAPQRAAIYLDDEKYGIVGYTPWEGRLQKGDWKIIVKLDGYETATRVVRIKRSRRTQEFFLPLVKKEVPAKLDVIAAADNNTFGAEVWVDGQLQGNVPVVLNVKEGRHLVEIKKAEFQDYSQWVDVKEGERVTIAPVLKPVKKEPQKGSVLVDADVQDAEVYIDGQLWRDKTPTLVPDIPEGPHVVEVRKEPAMPWKQTVVVKAGQTVKVNAELQATIGGPGGSIRVLSSAPKAEVWVDGTRVGEVPIDVKDLKPGEHVIEVRAPGFLPRTERVEVSAGSAAILQMDLQPEAGPSDAGTLKVVSPVPDAAVSIDGARIGPVPQTKEVSAGEHFVRVEKKGYRTFEQKVRVEAGQEVVVTADLKAAGEIRVLSNPSGAAVSLDGEVVGKTPFTIPEVSVGEHVIAISRDGYYQFEKLVNIEGGKREVINATLKQIDLGPTEEELLRERRSRSSFGARTLMREKPTFDASVGYPHFLGIRFTIGVGQLKGFGLDAGIGVQTFFQRTDLSVHTRIQLLDRSPVSVGAFATAGYGTRFDRSQRDSYFIDAGGMLSLTAIGRLTITGRLYLSAWTDRFCPPLATAPQFEARSEPTDLCKAYLEKVDGMDYFSDVATLSDERFNRINQLLDDDGDDRKIFERNGGIRLMIALIVEYAVNERINVWGMLDGTPSRSERPAYTDAFNDFLLKDDNGVYFRSGITYKF